MKSLLVCSALLLGLTVVKPAAAGSPVLRDEVADLKDVQYRYFLGGQLHRVRREDGEDEEAEEEEEEGAVLIEYQRCDEGLLCPERQKCYDDICLDILENEEDYDNEDENGEEDEEEGV